MQTADARLLTAQNSEASGTITFSEEMKKHIQFKKEK